MGGRERASYSKAPDFDADVPGRGLITVVPEINNAGVGSSIFRKDPIIQLLAQRPIAGLPFFE